LKWYLEFIKNKDLDKYEENRWVFEKPTKLLDGESIEGLRTAIVSYFRGGNTFLRGWVEAITGLATGSNMGFENTNVIALQYQGFIGEEHSDDNRCWLNKTHYPFVFFREREVKANKAIIVIRNPMDIVWSNYTFTITGTHDRDLDMEKIKEDRHF
jgi:hypothetical protein